MRFYNNPNGAPCTNNDIYVPSNGLVSGWQFCQQLGSQFDEDGHGTGVAGVIYMQDNAIGGVGVAHNTTLLPVALHNDTFNTFFISEAIRYAAAKGAKVINLSLGTPFRDTFLESTINNVVNQGVIVVASSGNCAIWTVQSCDWDGNNLQNLPEEQNNVAIYPAAFSSVIAVGASNYATSVGGITRSCYSNYGAWLDVVAPEGDGGTSCNANASQPTGVRIPCGFVSGACATINSYKYGFGTSYAAPQVAGAIALLVSNYPDITTGGVKILLEQKSTPLSDRNQFGAGLLNVRNFVVPNPNITSSRVDFNQLNGNILAFINTPTFETYNYRYYDRIWLSQTGQNTLIPEQTNVSYSSINDRGYINLFYADRATNEIKYRFSNNSINWSNAQATGMFTTKSFAAVNHLNTYNMFYVATDGTIRTKYFNGQTWVQDRVVPTSGNIQQVQVLVDREYINLFYLDANNTVNYIYTKDGRWSAPKPLNLLTTNKKFFVVNHLGTYNAFYIDLDNTLKRVWYNGAAWIDKIQISGEANITDVSGFVEKEYINLLFIRNTDNIPRYRYTKNGQWSAPTEIR
jgi:hypothetical protein